MRERVRCVRAGGDVPARVLAVQAVLAARAGRRERARARGGSQRWVSEAGLAIDLRRQSLELGLGECAQRTSARSLARAGLGERGAAREACTRERGEARPAPHHGPLARPVSAVLPTPCNNRALCTVLIAARLPPHARLRARFTSSSRRQLLAPLSS